MVSDCFHGGASFDAIGTDFDRLESKSKVIRADVIDAWYDPAPNVVEALEKNDPKILDHMHDVDIAVDKFHDYCIRILNKIGNKESRKISLLFSTIV